MRGGFVHADDGVVVWNNENPDESLERPEELQKRRRVKSFRLMGVPNPVPLEAVRCGVCRCVVFCHE